MTDELDDLIAQLHDHLAEDDMEAAQATLAELEKRAPDERDTMLARAAVEASEDPEVAMQTMARVAERFATDPVVLTVHASYHLELAGDVEAARPLLDEAVWILEKMEEEEAAGLRSEARALLSEVELALGEPRMALASAEAAVLDDDENELAHLALAGARFALCDLDGASASAARADELPEAHHLLGRVASARGDMAAATAAFARAAELDPDRFFVPVRTEPARFLELVEQAKGALDPELADVLADIAIDVTPRPDLEVLREQEEPLSPDIGAVAELGEETDDQGEPVTTLEAIVLFQDNLELLAADEEELVGAIAEALFDQLVDVLGLDDDETEDEDDAA